MDCGVHIFLEVVYFMWTDLICMCMINGSMVLDKLLIKMKLEVS